MKKLFAICPVCQTRHLPVATDPFGAHYHWVSEKFCQEHSWEGKAAAVRARVCELKGIKGRASSERKRCAIILQTTTAAHSAAVSQHEMAASVLDNEVNWMIQHYEVLRAKGKVTRRRNAPGPPWTAILPPTVTVAASPPTEVAVLPTDLRMIFPHPTNYTGRPCSLRLPFFPSRNPDTVRTGQPSEEGRAAMERGACYHPDTLIRMSPGLCSDHLVPIHFKHIQDIIKGDKISLPDGSEAMVLCVVKWVAKSNLVTLATLPPIPGFENLKITRYHPYLDETNPTSPEWKLPTTGSPTRCHTIYNLVLSRGHLVCTDGRVSVTIGHQLGPCDQFYSHSFWGSRQALDDIACHP